MWSSKSSFTDQCILIFVGLMFGIFICQILSGSNGKSQINYMLQSEQLKIRNIYTLTNTTTGTLHNFTQWQHSITENIAKKQSVTTKILILAYPR